MERGHELFFHSNPVIGCLMNANLMLRLWRIWFLVHVNKSSFAVRGGAFRFRPWIPGNWFLCLFILDPNFGKDKPLFCVGLRVGIRSVWGSGQNPFDLCVDSSLFLVTSNLQKVIAAGRMTYDNFLWKSRNTAKTGEYCILFSISVALAWSIPGTCTFCKTPISYSQTNFWIHHCRLFALTAIIATSWTWTLQEQAHKALDEFCAVHAGNYFPSEDMDTKQCGLNSFLRISENKIFHGPELLISQNGFWTDLLLSKHWTTTQA